MEQKTEKKKMQWVGEEKKGGKLMGDRERNKE